MSLLVKISAKLQSYRDNFAQLEQFHDYMSKQAHNGFDCSIDGSMAAYYFQDFIVLVFPYNYEIILK